MWLSLFPFVLEEPCQDLRASACWGLLELAVRIAIGWAAEVLGHWPAISLLVRGSVARNVSKTNWFRFASGIIGNS